MQKCQINGRTLFAPTYKQREYAKAYEHSIDERSRQEQLKTARENYICYFEYEDETLRIDAFGSTDVGSSFLIHLQDWSVFHAHSIIKKDQCADETQYGNCYVQDYQLYIFTHYSPLPLPEEASTMSEQIQTVHKMHLPLLKPFLSSLRTAFSDVRHELKGSLVYAPYQ